MCKGTKRCTSLLLAFALTVVFCLGNVFSYQTAAAAGQSSVGSSGGASSIGESNRKIDVWDFGGVEQTGELYNNNIALSDFKNLTKVTSGTFSAGNTVFGDLSITHNANDRLYAATSSGNSLDPSLSTTSWARSNFDDEYNSFGGYYCNGAGSESTRYLLINNVVAGDKIVVYAKAFNNVSIDLSFKYIGSLGSQVDTKQVLDAVKNEFVAKYSGTYKIYESNKGGKPIFYRAMRIPGIKVSGSIDLNGNSISGYSLSFRNETTNVDTNATLNDNSFNTVLAPGYSYIASLNGATGYGISNYTKRISPQISDMNSGLTDVKLQVVPKPVYTYTGEVVGFSSYDTTKLAINLEAEKSTMASDVALKLSPGLSFSEVLEANIPYTAKMTGANDYEIIAGGTLDYNKDTNADIIVAPKPTYNVSGGYLGLPEDKTVTAITFTNDEDGYVYSGTVTSTGYTGTLRNGGYTVKATVDGYKTNTHILVNGAGVIKDLLFVTTNTAITPIPRVADIYVGYSEKANNYPTVNAAMLACKAMNPTSEAERITVHIKPGTYREQINVTAPYISMVNDEQGEVLLTWYYGIGYKYYSSDIATQYYNPESAYDKYNKQIAAKWGCSTYVQATATGFKAENITFEASFNRYVTQEEIDDGVEVAGNEAITFKRILGADVTSKTATERSTAMAIEADKFEFYNCTFLSSQDTLYTGSQDYSGYFKNCFIEGNTDYIFGDANVVFDGCNLSWKGYSDTDKEYPGYLTAARPNLAANGYLFRNCTVTGNENLTVAASYFGRPWGSNAKVAFMNTKLESGKMITDVGWTDMTGKAADANFAEYNTTIIDGTIEDTSLRVVPVKDDAFASKINVLDYFKAWAPSYFVTEESNVAFAVNPSITSSGDINSPSASDLLTVNYSLGTVNDSNDASVIRWYRVAKDNTETLVKSSTAIVNKTYKISAADKDCYIKVVVIPQIFSGKLATEQSYKTNTQVDPTPETKFSIDANVTTKIDDANILSYLNNEKYDTNQAILVEFVGVGDNTKFVKNTDVKVFVGTLYSGKKYNLMAYDSSQNKISPLNKQLTIGSDGYVTITVPSLGKYLLLEVKASNDNGNGQSGSGDSASDIKDFAENHGDVISDIQKSSTGSADNLQPKQITVTLGEGENVLPTSLFDSIVGKNVELTLNFGEFAWTLSGKQVTSPSASRVFYNLDVQPIKDQTISNAAGSSEVTQLEIAHNGAFPGTFYLTFNVGSQLSGTTIYLNYFNEKTKTLEPNGYAVVGSDGNVTFGLTHASKYVVTKENVAGTTVTKPSANSNGSVVKPNIKTGMPIFGASINGTTNAPVISPTNINQGTANDKDAILSNNSVNNTKSNNNLATYLCSAIITLIMAGIIVYLIYIKKIAIKKNK